MIDRVLNSLFDAAARRFSNAVRDVGQFVAEVNTITSHVKSWRGRVQRIDENKLAVIQEAVEELRVELRGLVEEMDVSEGKLKEAQAGAELAIDRLATGEHLLNPENRKLLLQGDVPGMVEHLTNIDPVMFRRAIRQLDRDRLADLYQMIKGELGLD